MFTLRRADERGHADHGWLTSRHTFSFADYHDARHMGFRALRVINDDRVAPARGFGTHPHRDMEILSYVLEGALQHRDSMGNGGVIRPGDLQRMSAGTGVMHSEFNASRDEPVHFLQIWIQPDRAGITPGYEQKTFALDEGRGRLQRIASPDGRDGSVTIHADANLYRALLVPGASISYVPPPRRHTWIHVARGAVRIGGIDFVAGDAVSTSDASRVDLDGSADAEVLLFDLA